jgi:hypothetical protein
VVVAKVAGGDDSDGQDFTVTRAGPPVSLMPIGGQDVVNDDKTGYNFGSVQDLPRFW